MANLTLAIPDELHERMRTHSEIRWSDVVRKSIAQKVEILEVMDKIAKKSRLTKKDLNEISHKINREVFNDLNKAK